MKLNEVKVSEKAVYFEPFVKDMKYRQSVLKDIAYSDSKLEESFNLNVTVHTDGEDVIDVLTYEMNGDPVVKNLDVKDGSLELFITYSLTENSKKALANKIKEANSKVDSDEDLGHLIVKIEDLEFAVLSGYTIQRVKVFTTN
jgi:hypothetical protein